MSKNDAFKACLTDGKAKQITMDFSRDADNKSIIDAYNDGFKENAKKEELASVQAALTQYLGYFDKRSERESAVYPAMASRWNNSRNNSGRREACNYERDIRPCSLVHLARTGISCRPR